MYGASDRRAVVSFPGARVSSCHLPGSHRFSSNSIIDSGEETKQNKRKKGRALYEQHINSKDGNELTTN